MHSIQQDLPFWKRMLSMLEAQLGSRCEITLHDLSKPYGNTIVDIRNGYITGRKVGDSSAKPGFELVRGTEREGDRYNCILCAASGKILRSSTSYVYNDDGEAIGALCINLDITETVALENFLRSYNEFSEPLLPAQSKTSYSSTDVRQVLEQLIQEAQNYVGIMKNNMDKTAKIKFLEYLDSKGAFLITKSSERICEYLKISKFTLYSYLDSIRSDSSDEDWIVPSPKNPDFTDTQ